MFALSDRLVDRLAAARPASATVWGVRGHDAHWEDLSPDGWAAWGEVLAGARAELDALPPPGTRWDRLGMDVLRETLRAETDLVERQDPLGHLNHLVCPFQLVHITLGMMDAHSEAGLTDIAARLEGLPALLRGYRQTLAAGLDAGRAVAGRQVASVVAQGDALVTHRPFDRWADGPVAARDPVLAARLRRAADVGHGAYGELTAWLRDTYAPRASDRDAVGRDRYLAAARGFLGTELDVEPTLAWGWEEVARLQRALSAALAVAAPGRSLAEAVAGWRTDPRATSPSPSAFLDRVRAWQDAGWAHMAGEIELPAALREVRVEAAPPGSPPGAWYTPPSEDHGRPGTITYSFVGDGPVPVFDQQSTAFHEGVPGHHLQLALQRSLGARITRLHRVIHHCTGYSEGWALYAEQLMDERAAYDDPVQRVGYLVNQIARACRVVLDIGLHLERPIPADACFEPGQPWTFERGVRFMTEVGGLRPEVAHSEVLRYLGWPGQAISYKVGQKLILELRDAWRARHPAADPGGFHRAVLGSGTVGLGLLRAQVLGAP